jgi:uncharacterized protein
LFVREQKTALKTFASTLPYASRLTSQKISDRNGVAKTKTDKEKTMSEQENVAIVQQAYNNFKSGNIQALLDLCADDIEWTLPEIENVPFAGTRKTRAGVGEFFALVGANQDVLQFEPRETIAQRDKVVSLGHYEWRVKSTGRQFSGDFAHVFTIRDGKIVAFHEYTDTATAAAAYRKAMSA